MQKTICLLPGDGIGPEIVAEAVKVLRAVEKKFGHSFTMTERPARRRRHRRRGRARCPTLPWRPARPPMPCSSARWAAPSGTPSIPPSVPNAACSVSARPSACSPTCVPRPCSPELAGACLLRPDISAKGLDLIVVRELTGGIYFGQPAGTEVRDGLRTGFNTMIYNEEEIARIGRVAFATARKRRKKVCSVDKANVLAVSRVWREVMIEVGKEYPRRGTDPSCMWTMPPCSWCAILRSSTSS